MQAQIKRQTLSDWIKEKNPIAMLSVRISFLFKQKLINRLKVNGQEQITQKITKENWSSYIKVR